ncbi:MAG: iron ABC transporter permease [Spirochaetales bacterium]|nr:iron ABC transporter permease [Spirochaetales bacterium]
MRSKPYSARIFLPGGLFLLGSILIFFYLAPPFRLIVKGGDSLFRHFSDNSGLGQSLLNSLRLGFTVFFQTALYAGFLAWLRVKTNIPGKKIMDHFVLISFIIPPYILALSWVQVFGKNGYLERIITSILPGTEWTARSYSLGASAAVLSLHLYPLMYLSLKNAMERINPDLERAALTAGASPARTFLTVTLPLILPNLLSTGLLVFSRALANFAVPALLSLPAGIEVIPTHIYGALSNLRTDMAASLSLVLILITTLLYLLQEGVLRYNKTEGSASPGRGTLHFRLSPLTKGSFVSFALLSQGLFCLIPLAAMGVSSFLKRWGLPVKMEYLTLANYKNLFFYQGKFVRAFANSLLYGTAAALPAALIGISSVLISRRLPKRGGKLFETAASWPMAIPNTVLAVAAIYSWNRHPMKLYGTPWAIIVTYMVLFTPLIMKQVSGLLDLHGGRLEKAARTAGASPLRAFVTITLPLIAPGIKAGFIICLMIALREIPIVLMLYSAGQETVGVLLFGMQSQSYGLEMTSALSLFLILLILGGNSLVERGRKRKKHD